MLEKRAAGIRIAEILSYKVRCGDFTQEGADKIWRLAVNKYEMEDVINDIFDMELSEEETYKRIERL